MQASVWTSALIPIAVGLLFACFRWLFPAHVAEPLDEPLTEEERRIYRRWEIGSLFPFFLFTALLGYAWYLALKSAAGLFHHETPDTRFLVQPTPIYWGIPAGFLGAITSPIPVDRL